MDFLATPTVASRETVTTPELAERDILAYPSYTQLMERRFDESADRNRITYTWRGIDVKRGVKGGPLLCQLQLLYVKSR